MIHILLFINLLVLIKLNAQDILKEKAWKGDTAAIMQLVENYLIGLNNYPQNIEILLRHFYGLVWTRNILMPFTSRALLILGGLCTPKTSTKAPVKMTIYPDLAHDSWTTTLHKPEVWQWLFFQAKPFK